jgi:UDP-N-acetylmuramoyl-tripeptide--D-alanyl-D-alanine ligase
MLQQNFYNNSNRYIKWIFKNKSKSFLTIDLLFIIALIIGIILKQIVFVMTIFYIIMDIYYYKNTKKETTKINLKITSRVKRMIFTFLVLTFILLYGCTYLDKTYAFLIIGLYASLNNFVIYIVNGINKPIEKVVYYYYFNKAKTKIKDMPRLSVIGITGSYGKTSSKNILADILKVKYDAMPTPKNFNTPYGLMLTINNHLDKFTEYFVAEMGACEVGQIKELCDFVHPKYGILTKIGVAHLDSFKTEENIQKTKFELIESLPSDGIGILNMDDFKQTSYKIKNNCSIKWISTKNKNADIYASNIKGTSSGMSFDIQFKGENKKYKLETKLLGSANVYNIMAAVLLAHLLGMNMDEITRGVKGIKTIEHRLEMKKLGNINIIDDAYNSNPDGAKMAVETLGLMPGFKVIVTPGMIELKDKQYDLNYEFGRQIAQVCDLVILVGKKQTKPIYDGLIDSKYEKEKIKVFDDVFEAFNVVRSMNNAYVLLENDLPDLFNE